MKAEEIKEVIVELLIDAQGEREDNPPGAALFEYYNGKIHALLEVADTLGVEIKTEDYQ